MSSPHALKVEQTRNLTNMCLVPAPSAHFLISFGGMKNNAYFCSRFQKYHDDIAKNPLLIAQV